MGRIDELVSAEFARWEQRGRGWRVWPEPVRPEPPFQEFSGYRLAQAQIEVDDGQKPGLLASLFDSLEKKVSPRPPPLPEEIVAPVPPASEAPLTAEFVASLPGSLDVPEDALCAFMDSLHDRVEPTGFEILGNHESVTFQFASSTMDAPVLQRQLSAFLPTLAFAPTQERLADEWSSHDGIGFIVDFGLAHEFMLPLHTRHAVDPFVGLVAALNELQEGEVGVLQVLFQCAQNPWPGSVWRAVTDANGKALFMNRLPLIPGTKEKLETPLFGVVVRAAAKAADFDRAATIVRDMASALRPFARQEGNRLIPLSNDDYPFKAHEEDLTLRQSRRSGMLLNREELLGFVHLPSDEVRAPRLRRERFHTKAAPASVLSPSGLLLGHNRHAGRTTSVRLSAEQRTRHMHIIGRSGTGKSTLLFNLIRQDIENGQGLAVLDPHGDLVERILGIIPEERIDDVVLVDPSDEDYAVGFNILHAHSNLERTLLASDLVSVFRRLSISWGDQMDSVLKNAILAFLKSSRRGTLADLRRFLVEPDFRAEYLTSVQDPEILYYWQKGFPLLAGNKSVGPIITRLNDFLATATIKDMVSQKENRLDFSDIMDSGKIFLAKLPAGLVGDKDCYLLGTLLVSKFHQVAMSRQSQQAAVRRDFWIFADEFDNFITPSMAQILKGTRKYRVGLTLAHHELHQLQRDPDVASAVLSNTSTRVVFHVGDEDARKLAEGFASFEVRDLQNLGKGEAIVRVEQSDHDFNLSVPLPEETDPLAAAEIRKRVVTASREKYATPRGEIESASAAKLKSDQTRLPKAGGSTSDIPKSGETPLTPKTSEIQNPAKAELEPAPALPSSASRESAARTSETSTDEPEESDSFHQDAKKHITEAATTLDYTVTPEQWVLQGSGRVDLVLRRGSRVIACEICSTSTAGQEVEHVVHRLKADFTYVAVVCKSHKRLSRIQQTVTAALPADKAAQVGYFHLAEFISQLREWARQDPAGGEAERAKPRKREDIRLGSEPSAEVRKLQEKAWLEEIDRAMKIPPMNPS